MIPTSKLDEWIKDNEACGPGSSGSLVVTLARELKRAYKQIEELESEDVGRVAW